MGWALIREEVKVKRILVLFFFSAILFHISNNNFVLFHTLIEFICILVAFNMLVLSINTYDLNPSLYIIFIGIAYGFVAILDFGHIIAFPGVNMLLNNSANMTVQFWVAARLMECLSILIACSLINKKSWFKLK